MIDKTTADWQDVNKLTQLLAQGKNITFDAVCLSHVKYPNNKGIKMHERRQKYRRWLQMNAKKEYGRVKKLCQALE